MRLNKHHLLQISQTYKSLTVYDLNVSRQIWQNMYIIDFQGYNKSYLLRANVCSFVISLQVGFSVFFRPNGEKNQAKESSLHLIHLIGSFLKEMRSRHEWEEAKSAMNSN